MATGFSALRHDDIHTRCHVARSMLALATHGTHHHLGRTQLCHHIWRRRAQCTHDELDLRVRQCNVQQAARAVGRHVAAPVDDVTMHPLAFICGQRWHAFVIKDFVHEGAVPWGNQVFQVLCRPLRLLVILGGDDDVHAIATARYVLVNPAQLGLELFRRKGGRTQHAKAPCLGNFHDHVTTV